ncbi:MAG TPA: SpoIVB peptidase S55 [Acidobacteriaceae bacterium]|jgi:hypothetical protein|nr:SpoIVB peptidase S55 [Acidobacteriaceae bacterium]
MAYAGHYRLNRLRLYSVDVRNSFRDSLLPVFLFAWITTSLLGMAPSGMAQVASAAPSGTPAIFPLSAVHRGLHGTAYTVFQGTEPEAIDVEILGVLHDAIGPGKDMILARLLGSKAEYDGVVAGMSGSPVYIDGKLLGAIGFRIGQFTKEPIAGITPIQQMLDVVRQSAPETAIPSTAVSAGIDNTRNALAMESSAAANMHGNTVPDDGTPFIQPIDTPLVFDGYSPEALQLFRRQFGSLGLTPVSGLGSASPNQKQPEPIVPGSAISAVIVEGDLNISATCTVTYVDAKQLLACGHPITQFGHVSLPMTKAEVVATVASQLDPIKIINTTETVGAFTDDRQSGILGRFGVQAPMIPVTVAMRGFPQPKTFHFSVVENPRLTPGAVTVSVYQALQGTNGYNDQSSYRMHGEIQFDGYPPVTLDSLFSPDDHTMPSMAAAVAISQRFGLIYSNPAQRPPIHSISLQFDAIPGRRTAIIEDARIVDPIVHPGSRITVEATILPYRGERRVVRIPVQLPETLGAGTVRLLVSDGAVLDRTLHTITDPAVQPLGLSTVIAQLNRLHDNDRLYVTLLAPVPQATMDGVQLPSVPLSMANVLQPTDDGKEFAIHGETAVSLGSAPVNAVLQGSQILNLEIHP